MEKLSKSTNALNWFEIPVRDMARAKKFYEEAFGIEMQEMNMMNMQMAMFPSQSPHSGGALVKSDYHKPSAEGSIIYLNGNPDLQVVLDRIKDAGGQITMSKTNIDPDTGNMAFFMDTEGNMVGIHSIQ
jgi:uncharacterized protein